MRTAVCAGWRTGHTRGLVSSSDGSRGRGVGVHLRRIIRGGVRVGCATNWAARCAPVPGRATLSRILTRNNLIVPVRRTPPRGLDRVGTDEPMDCGSSTYRRRVLADGTERKSSPGSTTIPGSS